MQRTEDLSHFLLDCPAYASAPAALHGTLTRVGLSLEGLARPFQLARLLGAKSGNFRVDTAVDRALKRFLKKAWRARKPVTETINTALTNQF